MQLATPQLPSGSFGWDVMSDAAEIGEIRCGSCGLGRPGLKTLPGGDDDDDDNDDDESVKRCDSDSL
jgi:hypothetical protein